MSKKKLVKPTLPTEEMRDLFLFQGYDGMWDVLKSDILYRVELVPYMKQVFDSMLWFSAYHQEALENDGKVPKVWDDKAVGELVIGLKALSHIWSAVR